MDEKALKFFQSAWNTVKNGDLFNEQANTTLEYTARYVWESKEAEFLKKDVLNNLPKIFAKSKGAERPAPIFYILISLKDPEIIQKMQGIVLLEWIKSNAAEEETFQVLNFIQTFAEKQIPIHTFVNVVIKHINLNMNKEMIEALSHMITTQHPEFMEAFLKKFMTFVDRDPSIIKTYVQMTGRKAQLALMQVANPGQITKLFGKPEEVV